jgi:hypothetical protein
MLLRRIEIENFLSIKRRLPVDFDRKVSVLLGSNDHGKSNILAALLCLNDDTPILEDEINWDANGETSISFSFDLTGKETKAWKEIVEKLRKDVHERTVRIESASEFDGLATAQQTASALPTDGIEPIPVLPAVSAAQVATPPAKSVTTKTAVEEKHRFLPEELPQAILNPALANMTLSRVGTGKSLQIDGVDIS